jgi:hypothetical protein
MTAKPDQLLVDTVVEMHRSIMTLSGQVGELNGKVGTFIKQMESQDDRTAAHDRRIGKVENRQHWYSGAGAVLGAIFGVVGVKLFHT